MSSPTSRTLEYLRRNGLTAGVVEKWVPQTRRRVDFLGFADVLALESGRRGVLAIQATSGDHHADRVQKIVRLLTAKRWLECGNRIEVWSWRKKGKAGERKVWTIRREPIVLADLARMCDVCGCHDLDCAACIERTGQPCYWITDSLCSACAP